MNKYIQLLRDAFLVGIMLIIIGIPTLFIFDKFYLKLTSSDIWQH